MASKKMTYIMIVAVVACGLAYMGWKLTSRNAYESAAYSVLRSDGDIELREYPDLLLATTEMGSRIQGDDGSFGRLFQYINGDNENQQKVAMTTPVFTDSESNPAGGQMGFVIPKDVVESNVPQPTNSQVQITKRTGGKFAVIRFAGRAELNSRKQQQKKLEDWIEQQGLVSEGKPEMASYDPPWTPGPLRRNEILIRIGS